MKSEWKVTYNPMAAPTPYRVYRIKDVSATDHSGNREYVGEYFADKAEAQKLADSLNQDA